MLRKLLAICLFVTAGAGVTPPVHADEAEHRIAFVIGEGAYPDAPLPTAGADAGLVAETLQAAGFDVVGARDLGADALRRSYADFLRRVSEAGPQTVAFVYLAGYGLQYGADSYYVPVDANVSRPTEIPLQAIRIADLLTPLQDLAIKARFFVADAAYKSPLTGARDIVPGLALLEPAPGSLIAYNAAPGTFVAPATKDYGLYAQLLSAELRVGGLAPDEVFERVRLRVATASDGVEVPWHASKIDQPFQFFERGPEAPALKRPAALSHSGPLRDLPVAEAYTVALARDDIGTYESFLSAYGRDPLARRIRILLAARREARTWALARQADQPPAYWTYLKRYPKGPHAGAARARLARLGVDAAPPAAFVPYGFDVPPPAAIELNLVDAGPIDLEDQAYDLGAPPPLVGDDWLAPLPAEFLKLPPPPDPERANALPVPVFVPLPVYVRAPGNIVRPRNNPFFGGERPRPAAERRRDERNLDNRDAGPRAPEAVPIGPPAMQPNRRDEIEPGRRRDRDDAPDRRRPDVDRRPDRPGAGEPPRPRDRVTPDRPAAERRENRREDRREDRKERRDERMDRRDADRPAPPATPAPRLDRPVPRAAPQQTPRPERRDGERAPAAGQPGPGQVPQQRRERPEPPPQPRMERREMTPPPRMERREMSPPPRMERREVERPRMAPVPAPQPRMERHEGPRPMPNGGPGGGGRPGGNRPDP